MQFSQLAAALFLVAAAPALSAPFDVKAEAEAEAGIDVKVGDLAIRADAKIDFDFSLHALSARYHECLNSEAHDLYKSALEIYHQVNRLMMATVCQDGCVRERNLFQIVFLISRGEDILETARAVNSHDHHELRRFWVAEEIKYLLDRFAVDRIKATRLPNLAFVEHAYKFVVSEIDLSIAAAVALPGEIVVSVAEAAEAVHRCLRDVKSKLHWAVREVEEEFIYIGHKIDHAGHKIKKGLKKLGHKLLDGIEDLGDEVHEKWDDFKDLFHHRCEDACRVCHRNEDSCGSNGVVVVAQEEDVDVSITVTRKQAITQVSGFVTELKQSSETLHYDLHTQDTEVVAAFARA